MKVDSSTGLVNISGPDFGFGGSKFRMGIQTKEGHVFSPPSHDQPAILHIAATDMEEIHMIGKVDDCYSWKCGDAVIGVDGKVYCVPMNCGQVIRIDSWFPSSGAAASKKAARRKKR